MSIAHFIERMERVPFVSVYLKEFGGLYLGATAGVEVYKFRPTKTRVGTQIKNGSLDLESTTEVALNFSNRKKFSEKNHHIVI